MQIEYHNGFYSLIISMFFKEVGFSLIIRYEVELAWTQMFPIYKALSTTTTTKIQNIYILVYTVLLLIYSPKHFCMYAILEILYMLLFITVHALTSLTYWFRHSVRCWKFQLQGGVLSVWIGVDQSNANMFPADPSESEVRWEEEEIMFSY